MSIALENLLTQEPEQLLASLFELDDASNEYLLSQVSHALILKKMLFIRGPFSDDYASAVMKLNFFLASEAGLRIRQSLEEQARRLG